LIHTIRGVGYQLGLDTSERASSEKTNALPEADTTSVDTPAATSLNPAGPLNPLGSSTA
jgi:hypothetical protein